MKARLREVKWLTQGSQSAGDQGLKLNYPDSKTHWFSHHPHCLSCNKEHGREWQRKATFSVLKFSSRDVDPLCPISKKAQAQEGNITIFGLHCIKQHNSLGMIKKLETWLFFIIEKNFSSIIFKTKGRHWMSRNTMYKFQTGMKKQKIIARKFQMTGFGPPAASVWPMNYKLFYIV